MKNYIKLVSIIVILSTLHNQQATGNSNNKALERTIDLLNAINTQQSGNFTTIDSSSQTTSEKQPGLPSAHKKTPSIKQQKPTMVDAETQTAFETNLQNIFSHIPPAPHIPHGHTPKEKLTKLIAESHANIQSLNNLLRDINELEKTYGKLLMFQKDKKQMLHDNKKILENSIAMEKALLSGIQEYMNQVHHTVNLLKDNNWKKIFNHLV